TILALPTSTVRLTADDNGEASTRIGGLSLLLPGPYQITAAVDGDVVARTGLTVTLLRWRVAFVPDGAPAASCGERIRTLGEDCMTRKLVWTGFITVDGAMDSPGGTREGHPSGGWVFDTEFVEEAYSLKGEELADTSALVFGRRSYEAFGAVWPRSQDHAAYKELPKYVVSSTIGEDALVGDWG